MGLRAGLAFGERVRTETSCYTPLDGIAWKKVGWRTREGVSVRGWFVGERVAARRPAACCSYRRNQPVIRSLKKVLFCLESQPRNAARGSPRLRRDLRRPQRFSRCMPRENTRPQVLHKAGCILDDSYSIITESCSLVNRKWQEHK